ncbi:Phosphatidylcholine:ceramide cholinephosphotransferase 2 [Aphelenchoides bicaudatus]|nr:Phosphatidylcholine:ceramide cholinephosphotransferase 2 [Aphelenchoides bicaudatus]
MKGHRRDQSESHTPLRDSEQISIDNQEVRITFNSPSDTTVSNGSINQTSFVECNSTGDALPTTTRPNNERRTVRRSRMELVKTAVAFYFLMVAAFLNFFLLTVIHDLVPKTKPLPDLVFALVDQKRWAWVVGDVLSTINSVIGFTIVLLHRQRLVVIRRVFLIGAIMYGLRAVILSVTLLPPSFNDRDEICQPQSNRTGNNGMYASEIATRFVTYVVTLGLTSGQPKILCGDLMFSGHTVVLATMYFTQLHYTPRGLTLLRYISTPITFLGIIALVVSGGHYSMDVLVAYWLTSHVFWGYHQIFELPKSEQAKAPMSRLWYFWMCHWFEFDVPSGRMDNEWDWPFPKPRFMKKVFATINSKLQ